MVSRYVYAPDTKEWKVAVDNLSPEVRGYLPVWTGHGEHSAGVRTSKTQPHENVGCRSADDGLGTFGRSLSDIGTCRFQLIQRLLTAEECETD